MARQPTGAPRGRPRKPTSLKVLHGDFKGHPGRRNDREPVIIGEAVPPDTLSAPARRVWDEMAPVLIRAGVLTPADAAMFAEYCEVVPLVRLSRVAALREITGHSEPTPNTMSATAVWAKMLNTMMNIGGRFGMSPADRARISAQAPHPTDHDDLLS